MSFAQSKMVYFIFDFVLKNKNFLKFIKKKKELI